MADAAGEWTVSRRFRNFETLHRALREVPGFRGVRLPAKKMFGQQHSVEFVEERRCQLDGYLQELLAHPGVAGAAGAPPCSLIWHCVLVVIGTGVHASLRRNSAFI